MMKTMTTRMKMESTSLDTDDELSDAPNLELLITTHKMRFSDNHGGEWRSK